MAKEHRTQVPGAPSPPRVAAVVSSSSPNSQNKKSSVQDWPNTQGQLNGHHAHTLASQANITVPASAAQFLAERAESRAAVAAVGIVQAKQDDNDNSGPGGTPTGLAASPVARALAKRVKAMTKKLQRISQYEDLPAQKLNEDQKKAIASKPTQHAILKELQEVAKALDQVETEREAELQAKAQADAKVQRRNAETSGDEALVTLHQILRLFTLLHVPQITPSFASSVSSSLLSSITSQEAAAIGKIYQDVVERSLYTAAEQNGPSTSAEEPSVQQTILLVEAGSSDEVLAGVTFARVRQLLVQLAIPANADDALRPPQVGEEDRALEDDFSKQKEKKQAEKMQDVVGIAPDIVQTPAAHGAVSVETTVRPAAVVGISFLQSSEVGDIQTAAEAPIAALEPEGGIVDAAPALSGERTSARESAAKGTILEQEPSREQPTKVDWSADVDEDDDLGDPMDAFPDQRRAGFGASGAETFKAAVTAPLQNGPDYEPTTPPLTATAVPSMAKRADVPQASDILSKQQQRRGGQEATASPVVPQSDAPPSKKGPVVDEDGFVLQTSKRTLHQQAQAALRGSPGRGRGRGRGGARGGSNSSGGNNASNVAEGASRGRGRGRGRVRGRGGAVLESSGDGAGDSS